MHLLTCKKLRNLFAVFMIIFVFCGCGKEEKEAVTETPAKPHGILNSAADIGLSSEDGANYTFTYGNDTYEAIFNNDTWKIVNSYKISNTEDMFIICSALNDLHPVPNKDHTGIRDPEDLVYEWEQHNLAYMLLPPDNSLKLRAKDVDLNSEDQGKSILDFLAETLAPN